MNEVDNIIKETKSHLWVRKYFIRGVSSFFAICFVTCIAMLLKELLSLLRLLWLRLLRDVCYNSATASFFFSLGLLLSALLPDACASYSF